MLCAALTFAADVMGMSCSYEVVGRRKEGFQSTLQSGTSWFWPFEKSFLLRYGMLIQHIHLFVRSLYFFLLYNLIFFKQFIITVYC